MYNKDLKCSFTIRLTVEDLRFCEKEAFRRGETVSDYIRWCISDKRFFAESESGYMNSDNSLC